LAWAEQNLHGTTQEVARLAGRLEQLHQAYAFLAGAQAVATPPVVVMAFPDHDSLTPFLPLYDAQGIAGLAEARKMPTLSGQPEET